MIVRISIPERVEIMREFRDKLLDLHEEFWEILSEKFAPFDRRNYESGCTAEDIVNNSQPYDDKDSPLITRIFNALDKSYDEIDARCQELDEEEAARDEGYEMFYAWDLGLCPYAMREYRRNRTPYVRNSLNWEEIAGFLKGSGMSRENTAQAVNEYLKDKDPDGDRVIAVTRETVRIKKTA